MDYSPKTEIIGGRGYGYDGGAGYGIWFFGIIVLLILFFCFCRKGHGEDGLGLNGLTGLFAAKEFGKAGHGHCNPFCASKPMNPAQGCVDTCTIDKDVIKYAYKTQKVEVEQAEKTRALIELNYREQANREYYKQLTESAELKNKIYQLETKSDIDKKFCHLEALMQRDYGHIQRHLDKIDCDMPRIEKCTIPVCPPRCVSGHNCHEPRRTCDC